MRSRLANRLRCVSAALVLSSLLVACVESEAPEVVDAPPIAVIDFAEFESPTVGTPRVEYWLDPTGPQPIRSQVPEYPWPDGFISGGVAVDLKIDADGMVRDARVVDSDPPGMFELEVGLTLGRSWRFEPSEEGSSSREVRIYFCFHGGDADWPAQALSTWPLNDQSYQHVSRPTYPKEARKAGIEGTVLLRVYVMPNGHVARQEVVESPSSLLDQAAMKGVSGWRFEVVRSCVDIPVLVPINFSLQ